MVHNIYMVTGLWPPCGDERSMYSLVAQLVEHLKLNQEVPGSLPGWGIMIFFSSQGKPDCQSHLLSLRQSFTYIAKQSRWTFIHGGNPSNQRSKSPACKRQMVHNIYMVTGLWPPCGDERSMYSLVAQLVEHLKLNQEVPGSLPGWGIMIFFSSQGKPDCQSHLLSLRQSFTYIAKQSRWTFIHGGNPSNQRSKSPACKRQMVHNIYMVTGLWPPCGDERSMYSLVAQLVEHLKLNQEVPGSLPGWGIMIFFSSQGKPDCQSHLLSLRQSFTYIAKQSRWTFIHGGNPSNQRSKSPACKRQMVHNIYMVTGLWPPCGDERSMYSLVAQLVEHLKLNQEVPGSLPGWGIMIFFSSQGKPDCQSHLLSLRQSFTYIAKQSRWTFIHGGNPSNQRSKSPACKRQMVHNIYMVTGLWPPCGDERSMYSLVAQLVEHLKLNQEVPGLLPGWGIMIFFSSQGKPDCQSHLLSLRQSFTYIAKQSRWTFIHGGNPSNQRSKSPACKRQMVHNIYMVTGLWPPCGDERSMYSLVAQLVEHLKLNQEVPGSLPGWGIMIFFSSQGKPDCQSHLLSLRQSFTFFSMLNTGELLLMSLWQSLLIPS